MDVHLGDVLRIGEVRAGGSYLSGNDRRLVFALPDGAPPDSIVVRWPSGTRRTLIGLEPGRYHPVHEEDGS